MLYLGLLFLFIQLCCLGNISGKNICHRCGNREIGEPSLGYAKILWIYVNTGFLCKRVKMGEALDLMTVQFYYDNMEFGFYMKISFEMCQENVNK